MGLVLVLDLHDFPCCSALFSPRFNPQSLVWRIFLWKHNSVKVNQKINHIGGNLDISASGDTRRGHE